VQKCSLNHSLRLSQRFFFFVRNARHATDRLLEEFALKNGLGPRKGETSMRRTIIAIAAATVLGMAAMTTGAMAGHGGGGGGGGHGSGGGGHFAGGGGHYGGGSGRGHGRGLGAGAVGIGSGLYGYAGDICDYGGPAYGTSYCGTYNSW
jgi:hypothetical protein